MQSGNIPGNFTRERRGWPTSAVGATQTHAAAQANAAAAQAPATSPLSDAEKTAALKSASDWAFANPKFVDLRLPVFQQVLTGIAAGNREIFVSKKPADFPDLGKDITVTAAVESSAHQLDISRKQLELDSMRRDLAAYEAAHKPHSNALDNHIQQAKQERKGEFTLSLSGLTDIAKHIAARRENCQALVREINALTADAAVQDSLKQAGLVEER